MVRSKNKDDVRATEDMLLRNAQDDCFRDNTITLLRVIPTMTFIDLLLANLLAFYLTYLLAFDPAFYLAYLLAYILVYLLACLLAFYLAYFLADVLAYLLAYLLAFHLTFYLAYLLAFYLPVEVQQCTLSWGGPRLRSSGAHCAGQIPG